MMFKREQMGTESSNYAQTVFVRGGEGSHG